MLNSNCDLKICDFGLARSQLNKNKMKEDFGMTDYVTTRWFRAPELLLSQTDYNGSVDMWSVGCIFAQILRRKSLLRGTSSKNQLELIFELIGTPSEEEIEAISNPKSRKFVQRCKKMEKRDLKTIFPDASDVGLNLLGNILVFDPKKRFTCE